jgi:hypothetical protein
MANSSTPDIESTLTALAGDPVFQRLGVTAFRPEFGEDANGDPAIWVYVLISDEVPPRLAGGAHFEEQLRIQDALEAAGWAGPVYPRFRLVSEDLSLHRPAGAR